MTKALDLATQSAKDWLADLDQRPVQAKVSYEELISRLSGPLPESGSSPEDVVSYLTENMQDGLLGSAGGRFFAWVIGGGLESALAADWLVATRPLFCPKPRYPLVPLLRSRAYIISAKVGLCILNALDL